MHYTNFTNVGHILSIFIHACTRAHTSTLSLPTFPPFPPLSFTTRYEQEIIFLDIALGSHMDRAGEAEDQDATAEAFRLHHAANAEREAGRVVGSRLCSSATQTLLNMAKGLPVVQRHELLQKTKKDMESEKKELDKAITEVGGLRIRIRISLGLGID